MKATTKTTCARRKKLPPARPHNLPCSILRTAPPSEGWDDREAPLHDQNGNAPASIEVPAKDRPKRLNPIKQKHMEDRCAFLEEEVPRIEAAIARHRAATRHLCLRGGNPAPDRSRRKPARAVSRVHGGVGRADASARRRIRSFGSGPCRSCIIKTRWRPSGTPKAGRSGWPNLKPNPAI